MKRLGTLIMLSAGALLLSLSGYAQSFRYANEALLFSRTSLVGPARVQAMGGAQIGLGGHAGSAYMNPAGLGFYNRNEVSFTPTFFNSANDATYFGNESYNYRSNVNINNFALVLSSRKDSEDRSGWLGGTFSLAYHRMNTFNDQFSYRDTVKAVENSLIGFLEDKYFTSTSLPPSDFLTSLAYETYLVGDYYFIDDQGEKVYFYALAPFPTDEFPAIKQQTIKTTGNQGVWSFSYGGNFSDKYYIGANINFGRIDYNVKKTFSEIYHESSLDVSQVNIVETQNVTGSGLGANLGFIARPLRNFTIGITYQTPSIYSLEEEYTTRFSVDYKGTVINDENDNLFSDQVDGKVPLTSSATEATSVFEYNLKTPGKLGIGGAYFFEKYGFISADVEYIDYTNSRLTDDSNSLNPDNEAIRRDFNSALNYRLGGELRLDIFRLRAGYAYFADPYSNKTDKDRGSHSLTGGAGLKFKNYFVDLALVHNYGDRYYVPDLPPIAGQSVSINNRNTSVLLSAGLTF